MREYSSVKLKGLWNSMDGCDLLNQIQEVVHSFLCVASGRILPSILVLTQFHIAA